MRESTAPMDELKRHSILVPLLIVCICCVVGLFGVSPIAFASAVLEGIYSESPSRLRLHVSERIPSKVILVDEKEVLIALKNIRPGKKMSVFVKDAKLFKSVELETLSGNVLAVLVTGERGFKETVAKWDESGRNLNVDFLIKEVKSSPSSTASHPSAKTDHPKSKNGKIKQTDSTPEASSQPDTRQTDDSAVDELSVAKKSKSNPATQPDEASGAFKHRLGDKSYGSPKNKVLGKAGDISDMVVQVDLMTCDDADLKKAVLLLKQEQWNNAYELLEDYVAGGNVSCLEKAELLKAFAFYQTIGEDDFKGLVTSESQFQSVLVRWPQSSMRPFSHAALGLVYDRLSNVAASEGHFTIVKEEFKDYSGLPEVLYHLGKIYDQKAYNEKALEHYREVFDTYPESVYAVDAGVGLGKSLFKKRHYIDSRDILTALVETNPEIIYDSPDVLLSIGDAEYALGQNEPARNVLSKAYNLFGEIPDKDMVMTKIGDTYANQKKLDRAKKVYGFVMDRFPGTEGFLGSAMGLALCLTKREKIEEIYNMVKADYADHRLARVAMMRLAELYHKEGEYEKCIEEVEALLATHPTGLRYDAVKLMQSAYEALFGNQLKFGEYPEVLKTYEGAKVLLDRLESRKIFMLTGLAYGRAKLFGQSYNQLSKAYQQYEPPDRPNALIFGMGVAMDETDRDNEALKELQIFTEKVNDGPEKVKALIRMADILVKQEKSKAALPYYADAFQASNDRIEKGGILELEAEIHRQKKAWDTVIDRLEKAITEYGSAPGENYELMSRTYKNIGKAHLEQKAYVKAAEVFTMALKFSDSAGEGGGDIAFMLGDAYQKANAIDKAKETFQKIAEGEDSIWARLARERLSTLTLAETLSNSGA